MARPPAISDMLSSTGARPSASAMASRPITLTPHRCRARTSARPLAGSIQNAITVWPGCSRASYSAGSGGNTAAIRSAAREQLVPRVGDGRARGLVGGVLEPGAAARSALDPDAVPLLDQGLRSRGRERRALLAHTCLARDADVHDWTSIAGRSRGPARSAGTGGSRPRPGARRAWPGSRWPRRARDRRPRTHPAGSCAARRRRSPRRRGPRPARGVVAWMIGFGRWPMASITVCTGSTNSLPAQGTGRRRPDSSGSPSSMRWHSRPRTQPWSSPTMRTGLVRRRTSTPSSSACRISSRRPGISARERR